MKRFLNTILDWTVAALAAPGLIFLVLVVTSARADSLPQMRIAVIVDKELAAFYTDEAHARAEVNEIIGNAHAVYRDQLGIDLQMTSLNIGVDTPADTQPVFLLDNLRAYDHHGAYALVLFTARNMKIGQQSIAGYSTNGPMCSAQETSIVHIGHDWLDNEVLEHELGHALGLPHDNTGVCAAAPFSGYIMATYSTGADHFSQCSIDVVKSALATQSSCIDPALAQAAQAAPAVPTAGGGGMGTGILIALAWIVIVVAIGRYRSRK